MLKSAEEFKNTSSSMTYYSRIKLRIILKTKRPAENKRRHENQHKKTTPEISELISMAIAWSVIMPISESD